MTSRAWWPSSCPMPVSMFRDNRSESMAMSKPSDISLTATAVIGSGFIGRAWAISFARAGSCVRLWDQAEGAGGKGAGHYFSIPGCFAHHRLPNWQKPGPVARPTSGTATLGEAVGGAGPGHEDNPRVL